MPWIVADLLAVARQSAVTLLRLAPYVLAGALVGAFLLRRRHSLTSRSLLSLPVVFLVPVSALAGTVSPLCTLGTVPMVVALVGCGLPTGAAVAFLSSSSLANPQILLLAIGTIGPALAVSQWLSAIGIGCVAGWAAVACERRGIGVVRGAMEEGAPSRAPSGAIDAAARHGMPGGQQGGLWFHFLDQLGHVLIYVVVGVLAASAVNVWMPGGALPRLFGPGSPFGVAAGTVLSVPFYVCGGGVLPTLAELLHKGVSAGAVLAFIIAGPATRFQALAAVAAVLRARALAAYVVLVWFWAFAAGIGVDLFLSR